MNIDGSHMRRGILVSLAMGIAGAVVLAFGFLYDRDRFFQSYLMSYSFFVGLAWGCLALAMLHHLSGGTWGFVMLRFLEAGSLTLPLMLVLFVPLLFGLTILYPWMLSETGSAGSQPAQSSAYLNLPFFLARAVFYFLVWVTLAFVLRRWSAERDLTSDPELTRKLSNLSAIGLVAFGLTATFAAIDWGMSLEPRWYSTVYPMMVIAGGGLTAYAFVLLLVAVSDLWHVFPEPIAPQLLNDLGSVLLALVMIWAYLAFSQYLITWSGNTVQEIQWYLHRLGDGWQVVALLVALLNFGLPFLLLISRDLKRNARLLAFVALMLLFARAVDTYWLVMPAFYPGGLALHWLDLAALIAFGGLWMAVFLWALSLAPLLPTHDRAYEPPAQALLPSESE